MPTTKLIILDEVNCKFQGLDAMTRRKLTDAVKYYLPYAKHIPAVRLGRWDGSVTFCDVAGRTYLNLLDRLLPIVQQQGYDIEIEDLRSQYNFEFEKITNDSYSHLTWPEGHPLAGQPIMVRDHQVEVVNSYLENMCGINIAPTGAGKCLDANTRLPITVIKTTEFGEYFYRNFPGYESSQGINIGMLVRCIESYYGIELVDNQEVSIGELSVFIDTPSGVSKVNYIIKKAALPMCYVSLINGYSFRTAAKHIVRREGVDTFVTDLRPGDFIDHRYGDIAVASVTADGVSDCYDINVDAPNLYYDSNGVVHHNTIITAILSHKIEPFGRSIVIVPTKDLVTQTEEDYINFGLDVGVFYGDRKEYRKTHTICTWQSLESLSKKTKAGDELEVDLHEFFKDVVCVIADEVHRVKGAALKSILCGPLAHAPIRWGMTGTMPELEQDKVTVITSIGPVLNKIATSELQDRGILAKLHVNIWQLQDLGANAFGTYAAELKWLTSSRPRLEFLAEKFIELSETGNTLILVDRIETGAVLQSLIPDSIFISGKMKSADRKAEYKEVQQVNGKVIIATYGVASTGININRIFNLVLVEAGKSFVRVIQSIGRGIRVAEDKDFVNVYDVCSTSKYSKQHSTKRKKFYNEASYPYTVTKLNY